MTAWEQFEAVKALSGDQYDFVTAFILSWLAGAIDESGHISAEGDEAMRLALGSEVPC